MSPSTSTGTSAFLCAQDLRGTAYSRSAERGVVLLPEVVDLPHSVDEPHAVGDREGQPVAQRKDVQQHQQPPPLAGDREEAGTLQMTTHRGRTRAPPPLMARTSLRAGYELELLSVTTPALRLSQTVAVTTKRALAHPSHTPVTRKNKSPLYVASTKPHSLQCVSQGVTIHDEHTSPRV